MRYIAGFSGLVSSGERGTRLIASRISGAKHFTNPAGFANPQKYVDNILQIKPDFIALFGHSKGAELVLKITTLLERHNVGVDYVGIIDMTFFDQAQAGQNIRLLQDFHAAYNYAKIGQGFVGKREVFELDEIAGRNVGHTAAAQLEFTQNTIVETIASLLAGEIDLDSKLIKLELELENWLNPSKETEKQTAFWRTMFSIIRQKVIKPLNQSQIDGIKTQLFIWHKFHRNEPIEYLASLLGQEVRETGGRMTAIRETNRETNSEVVAALETWWASGEARKFGVRHPYWRHDGVGNPYGRGILQITLRDNYIKGKKLLSSEYGIDVPLDENYDLALHPIISAMLAIGGTLTGMYRRTKMSDHMTANGFDFFEAREVVNGDKDNRENGTTIGRIIEQDSKDFLEALEMAFEAGNLSSEAVAPKQPPNVEPIGGYEGRILHYQALFPDLTRKEISLELFRLFLSHKEGVPSAPNLSALVAETSIPQTKQRNETMVELLLNKLPFNGGKTYIGFVAIAAIAILEGPMEYPVDDYIEQIVWSWTGVSGAHKVQKLIDAWKVLAGRST